MRNFVFLLFMLVSTCLFAQVGNAYYNKHLSSITNSDSINNDYLKQALKILKNREYKLAFNNSEAIYSEVKSLQINENPVVEAYVRGLSEFYGEIYINSLEKSIIHKKKIADGTYLIQKNRINWILSKDTLRIDKYLCYKASTTRIIENMEGSHNLKVTAWYTPEISLQYGPDGYSGLPGLILQLNNNGVITSLKKIEFFKEDEDVELNFIAKGKKVTEDEFNSMMSNLYEDRKNKY